MAGATTFVNKMELPEGTLIQVTGVTLLRWGNDAEGVPDLFLDLMEGPCRLLNFSATNAHTVAAMVGLLDSADPDSASLGTTTALDEEVAYVFPIPAQVSSNDGKITLPFGLATGGALIFENTLSFAAFRWDTTIKSLTSSSTWEDAVYSFLCKKGVSG